MKCLNPNIGGRGLQPYAWSRMPALTPRFVFASPLCRKFTHIITRRYPLIIAIES
jgi:hypothetical protein